MAKQRRVALVAFNVPTSVDRQRIERCLRRNGFVAVLPTLMWRRVGEKTLARLRQILPFSISATMRGAPYVVVLLHAFSVDAAETLWMTHRGRKGC
jgi:hypothetical protein